MTTFPDLEITPSDEIIVGLYSGMLLAFEDPTTAAHFMNLIEAMMAEAAGTTAGDIHADFREQVAALKARITHD